MFVDEKLLLMGTSILLLSSRLTLSYVYIEWHTSPLPSSMCILTFVRASISIYGVIDRLSSASLPPSHDDRTCAY
ncbi:hypothetical protein F4813DRAFT_343233 [Daldinia decipiens]|uniref:uncharacterized protein n=1 Tax=Daldinia decipiens TaxID=326647 RepID=UPI0020C1CB2D|nr:uncharacterized protein F4813DRAFT_343233 [Daldinia decipiens]KAI1662024.1 hypothetical protein F4813DRAFT_343233 [Daldinia decipiens]